MNVSALIFSLLMSFSLILGESFRRHDGFDMFSWHSPIIIILFAGVLYFITITALKLLHGARAKKEAVLHDIEFPWLNKFPFLLPMLVTLLCWLPVWLTYFPGTLTWDGGYQLLQFMGYIRWSDHHPVFITIIYGVLFRAGSLISGNAGLFMIILLQMLSLAAAFSYAHVVMKRWGVPPAFRLLMIAFWALNPMFMFQLVAVLKDVPSTAVLMFFAVVYVDALRETKKLPLLAALGALSAQMRHSNLYIVLIALFLLVFVNQNVKYRVFVISSTVACFVIAVGFSTLLVTITNAEPGAITEALSIPFQQTARFVRDHPEEVRPEERAAIDAILRFDDLPELYVPYFSDPVRNASRHNDAGLPEYFRHWLNMGLRRPLTYINATFSNAQSYILPALRHPSHDWATGNAWVHHSFGFLPAWGLPLNTFDIPDTIEQTRRDTTAQLYRQLRHTLGLGMIFRPATWTWFLLFLLLLCKNRKDLFAFAPAFLVVLACIASPLDGHIRYFLPVLAMVPLLFAFSLYGRGIYDENRSTNPVL